MSESETEARLDELEERIRQLEQQQTVEEHVDEVTENLQQRQFIETPVTLRQVVLDTIRDFESAYGDSAPTDYIVEEVAGQEAHDTAEVSKVIVELREEGSIYEPQPDHLRVV